MINFYRTLTLALTIALGLAVGKINKLKRQLEQSKQVVCKVPEFNKGDTENWLKDYDQNEDHLNEQK